MNTNYGIRWPSYEEMRATFGSLMSAYTLTGGSARLLCFFIANPDQIRNASEQSPDDSALAKRLRKDAEFEEVVECWDQLERKSITECARKTHHSFDLTKRLLAEAGRLQPAAESCA